MRLAERKRREAFQNTNYCPCVLSYSIHLGALRRPREFVAIICPTQTTLRPPLLQPVPPFLQSPILNMDEVVNQNLTTHHYDSVGVSKFETQTISSFTLIIHQLNMGGDYGYGPSAATRFMTLLLFINGGGVERFNCFFSLLVICFTHRDIVNTCGLIFDGRLNLRFLLLKW
ncbi:hypothetical protein CEXT_793171 [Caerostris extrusa]|uniref:Uncharacterized protein n=1 Tax=Caerostris extrusa TaxID=172846 RepID=A0AAV4V510_CAEEX|nr:hypothetical protein CEXT_793171 [Caerostris extrusa]